MEMLYIVGGLIGIVAVMALLGGILYMGVAVLEFILTVVIGFPLMVIMETINFIFGYSLYLIKCVLISPLQTLRNPFKLLPWKYIQIEKEKSHQEYVNKVQSYAPGRPWEEAKAIYQQEQAAYSRKIRRMTDDEYYLNLNR